MPRVVVAFAFFALAHLGFAFAMRGDFGTVGAATFAAIGVGALVVLGVPAFLLFRRQGWLAWWQFAAGGIVLGLVCTLPLMAAGLAFGAALAPAFSALGMLHATLFWLLAVWRNKALLPK